MFRTYSKKSNRNRKKYKKKGISEDSISKIKFYSNLLRDDLYIYFRYFEIGKRKNVPPSSTYLIEYLTKNMSSEVNFILIPTHSKTCLYKEVRDPLRSLFDYPTIDNVNKIFPESSKKIALIMFPFTSKKTLIGNIVLVHEISHYVASKEDIGNKLYAGISIEDNILEEIQKYLQIEKIIKDINEIKKELVPVITSWFEEIYCDLIAFKMIGPAFLIAFSNYFLSKADPLKGFDDQHPPIELRLKILFNEYLKSNYPLLLERSKNPYVNKFKEHIDEYYEFVNNFQMDKSILKERYFNVYNIVLNKKDEIQRKANEASSRMNISCDSNKIISELDPLIKSLENLTTPCETEYSKPADPVSILNAAIIFEIEALDEVYKKYKPFMDKDFKNYEFQSRISGLILKGIEQCWIQKTMGPLLK